MNPEMHRNLYGIQVPARMVNLFLIIFYGVGVIGFIASPTQSLFIMLTKWALLLNFGLLAWLHQEQFRLKDVLILTLVFLFGYFIEVVGVQTGFIFGQYRYGSGLGLKIWETPLLIGMNWLMLSYCFVVVTNKLHLSKFLKVMIGATGMLIYDLILEQSAALLNMWYWEGETIPFQNYLSWFLIAALLQWLLHQFIIRKNNPLALTSLFCQTFFFLSLVIYKNFWL